jgi:DMATS type aromatic prenyltransferase
LFLVNSHFASSLFPTHHIQVLADRVHTGDMGTIPVTRMDGSLYWWRTSGRDLWRMLDEANYPQQTKHQFLDFYRDTICPLLGSAPGPSSLPTAVGWDGSPFEYSFEFKGTTRNPGVRFVLDLSQLRPADEEHPLRSANVDAVIKVLAMTSPRFDDTWVSVPCLGPQR